ncbi:MAG: 2-oxoacid:acceptor oxidoreductase family protein [Erysipelotrichaceae bacterium]
MKPIKLVCAGFGGQGVLSVGQMVALLAMKNNKEVSWMPSYGPEMRGGTANCHVVVDDQPIAAPIIASGITHLLAMNGPSLDKFLAKVAPGGTVIVNKAMIDHPLSRTDVKVIACDFPGLAEEAGAMKSQNMVAFGALIYAMDVFSKEDAKDVILEKFGGKKPELNEANLQAFEFGYSKH